MQTRKRFYKDVAAVAADKGWQIQLDGRAVKTPVGSDLFMPTAALAHAIADEWDAQTEDIVPARMPLFAYAVTARDRVASQREAVIAEITSYGGNDLLCYRADDAVLAARQAAEWQRWLGWAEAELNASLVVTNSIMPVNQPADVVDALRVCVAAYDEWHLAILHRTVSLGGSLVMGLAWLRGAIDSENFFATTFLDELWQVENWGSDWEAEDRRSFIRAELDDAVRFRNLLAD
jgi:chaperone required for assembly of F1-ATPase